MALTLQWSAAESADDTHDDISTDISGVLVALVTQDTHPRDRALGWRWCVEDWTWEPDGAWPPPEPATLAHGYVASQQAGRTAVMDWVRQHRKEG